MNWYTKYKIASEKEAGAGRNAIIGGLLGLALSLGLNKMDFFNLLQSKGNDTQAVQKELEVIKNSPRIRAYYVEKDRNGKEREFTPEEWDKESKEINRLRYQQMEERSNDPEFQKKQKAQSDLDEKIWEYTHPDYYQDQIREPIWDKSTDILDINNDDFPKAKDPHNPQNWR